MSTSSRYVVQTHHPRYDHLLDSARIRQALRDDLGRAHLAAAICGELRGPERPRIVGLYGSWGSGKSYLMDMVARRLHNENARDGAGLQVLVCMFNPWRHELEDDLAIGLIKALVEMAEGSFPDDHLERIRLAGKEALAVISDIVPVFLGLPGETGSRTRAAVAKVRAGSKRTEVQGIDLETRSNRVKAVLQRLVDVILDAAHKHGNAKDYRLVVLIDDLDRCSPEAMVRLLEWLKVHLQAEGCTYILALDHVAAARAIVGEYKKYLGESSDLAYGFRYLEKLVEREYELSPSPFAETMALRAVYGVDTPYRKLSDLARATGGGDFPGIDGLDDIMRLRALAAPRTALKVVWRYRTAALAIQGADATDVRNRLPSGYLYWLLLLVALYYRFDPDQLDEFVRGRGPIYRLFGAPLSVPEHEWGDDPHREFCRYAQRVGSAEGLQVPSPDVLAWLATVVREGSVGTA